jgi:hypothetical protein
MLEITKEMMDSDVQGFSVRMPKDFHNTIKAQAALEDKSKDEFFQELLVLGVKHYKPKKELKHE